MEQIPLQADSIPIRPELSGAICNEAWFLIWLDQFPAECNGRIHSIALYFVRQSHGLLCLRLVKVVRRGLPTLPIRGVRDAHLNPRVHDVVQSVPSKCHVVIQARQVPAFVRISRNQFSFEDLSGLIGR